MNNKSTLYESQLLKGKVGLVIGIANEESIAYGCAKHFRGQGASLAITYLNEKSKPYVSPLAEELEADIFMPMNIQDKQEVDAVFDTIKKTWGHLDFLVHSIAFMPKDDLIGRVIDCSLEGFLTAMDISCHSFLRLSKLAEKLMPKGGCLLAMSYYGANHVVEHYNAMGPVKAALESSVRYLASELGEKGIRVHALSPGPLRTRASSGIAHFDELMDIVKKRSPQRELIDIDDVGSIAAFLVSDLAKAITGNVTFVDAGYHVMG